MTPPAKISQRQTGKDLNIPREAYSGPGVQKFLQVANERYREHLSATGRPPAQAIQCDDLTIDAWGPHGYGLKIVFESRGNDFTCRSFFLADAYEMEIESSKLSHFIPKSDTVPVTDACTMVDRFHGKSHSKLDCHDVSDAERRATKFKAGMFLGIPAVFSVDLLSTFLGVTVLSSSWSTAPSKVNPRWIFPITRGLVGGTGRLVASAARAIFSTPQGRAFFIGFAFGTALDSLPAVWGSKKKISDSIAHGLATVFGAAHQHPRLVAMTEFFNELF